MENGSRYPTGAVAYIRELLAAADTDAAALDPAGARTAEEIEGQLESYLSGEENRLHRKTLGNNRAR
jgi:hypothetical protein